MINNHKKIIAWNLLTIFTFSNIIPINLLAVSSGPSQPEVETFQPIGASGLVNKYTGDFSYNLPLMTVPGPNGSYPINLIYNAGASMYQEASWVGLGWNLNPGVIKRHLNGVPDEFNGDLVTHFNYESKHTRRTNTLGASVNGSIGIGLGEDTENQLGGSGSLGGTTSWINDSHRGKGFSVGYHLDASPFAKIKNYKPFLGINNSVSLSSFDGITSSFGVYAGLGYTKGTFSGASLSSGINWTYNSKTGYRGLSFRSSLGYSFAFLDKDGRAAKNKIKAANNGKMPDHPEERKTALESLYQYRIPHSTSIGSSFTTNDNVTASIATSGMARTGSSRTWGLELGVDISLVKDVLNLGASASYTNTFSESEPKDKVQHLNSYGYLNLGNQGVNGAMDYATHNQVRLGLSSPNISYPKYAQDGFVANGQGLAGFFQAKRSDIGLLYQVESDGKIKHKSDQLGVTYNVGVLNDSTDNGITASYNKYVNSYSQTTIGAWDSDLLANFDESFKQTLSDDDYYEAYSFLSTGELTVRDQLDNGDVFFNDQPLTFELEETEIGSSFRDKHLFRINANAPSHQIKKGRTSRNQYFEPITFKEYNDIRSAYGVNKVGYLYEKNYHPDEVPLIEENLNEYVTNAVNSHPHHFKEIQVTNVGGELYEYGIPAYNNLSREINFSSNNLPAGTKVREIVAQGAGEGVEGVYRGSSFSDYAHSYLLTAIYSPDYVDVTNNGPTEDDFGYWVKFNYSIVHEEFPWGVPALNMANYHPGNANDSRDQYASYQSGSKKLYYLNSIETKTHIAKFKVSDRADGNGTSPTETVQKLDRIELYNKSDDIPLKTVHFKYDYSLCEGIPSFYSTNANLNEGETGSGKLTLKSLYTTYRNNLKGRLTPYTFDYGFNPDFKFGNFDSWGVYKDENTATGPYIDQVPFPLQTVSQSAKTERDLNASSWNLSKITLPSKGSIEVNYEMDDYLWVQNKKSMQLHEIVGMSTTSQSNAADISTGLDPIGDKYRIYFKLHIDDVSTINNIGDYVDALVKDIDMLYFRTWMKYNDKVFDYAKGYAPVQGNHGYIDYQGTKIGYIDIAPSQVYSSKMKGRVVHHGDPIDVHPFQAEVIKRIQHYRPDLEFDGDKQKKKKQLWKELRKGFEQMALDEKFGETFNVNNSLYPSFIRLNTANTAKYGGGHRVKSVRVTDNADDLGLEVASYGKKYHYINRNGNSSGVTGSEPFASKEESPFKYPSFYSSEFDFDDASFNDKELYTDYCLAEPFFPSANVGYTRVLEESVSYDGNGNEIVIDEKVAEGIIEDEYYTSKDFPVIYNYKLNEPSRSFDRPDIAPPVVSFYKKHDSYGFSQGLVVEVNDMSGKLKSVGKYPYYSDVTSSGFNSIAPVYEEEHFYQQVGNKLQSKVNLSNGETKDLGVDIQTAIAVEQNRNFSSIHDVQAKFKFVGLIPVPINVQYTDTRELDNAQTISSTKVIARNGILESKRTTIEGVSQSEISVKYSPVTGEVTESKFLDEFNVENSVITKKACEIYPQAQGKYLYDNIHFSAGVVGTATGSGNDMIQVSLSGRSDSYLKEGDKLLITEANNNKYIAYVLNVTTTLSNANTWEGDVEIVDYSGNSLNSLQYSDIKVIDPANTNQLTLDAYVKSLRGDKVISAQATTYKDHWLNNGFEKEEFENYSTTTFPGVPYTNGQKGILRPENVYTFNGQRVYNNLDNDKGVYDNAGFVDFNFDNIPWNTEWISPIKSSKYSPYGYGIESENLRGIKAASFYDYNKSLVTISAQNAAYKEIGFDAFEDYSVGETQINHGHLKWSVIDDLIPNTQTNSDLDVNVSDETRHTGSQSLKFHLKTVTGSADFEFNAGSINSPNGTGFWEFENNKKYTIQYWEKATGEVETLPFEVLGTHSVSLQNEIRVGNWVRKEYVLETDVSSSVLTMRFHKPKTLMGVVYIDDFKITPYNSASKTFVYDNHTFDLKAILDDNHFATMYQYDEQGNLVITKKETVHGVKSITSNRSNVKR